MTITIKPAFMNSEYVYVKGGIWFADNDAPKNIKRQVNEYNARVKKASSQPLVKR